MKILFAGSMLRIDPDVMAISGIFSAAGFQQPGRNVSWIKKYIMGSPKNCSFA
ncbi:MAG: hypothetical protein ABWK15_09635 [Dissulfuribacterales bacterium]